MMRAGTEGARRRAADSWRWRHLGGTHARPRTHRTPCPPSYAPARSGRATPQESLVAPRACGPCVERASMSSAGSAWRCSALAAPGPRRCSTVSPAFADPTRAASKPARDHCSSTRTSSIARRLAAMASFSSTMDLPRTSDRATTSLASRTSARPPSSRHTPSRASAMSPTASFYFITAACSRSTTCPEPAVSPSAQGPPEP